VINAKEACEGVASPRITIATRAVTLAADEARRGDVTSLLADGDYVELTVHDNGVGMDEDTRARIFDPFFSTKFVGRGLGLAVVHGVLRAGKGGVRVDSQLGHGTTVRAVWPVAAADGWVSSLAVGVAPGVAVVADPDAATRGVTARLLRAMGWTVHEADNVSSTLSACRRREGPPRVAILDEHLPSLMGLVSRLGSETPTTGLIVASRTPLDWGRGVAGQGRRPALLEKPYGPHTLAAALGSGPQSRA